MMSYYLLSHMMQVEISVNITHDGLDVLTILCSICVPHGGPTFSPTPIPVFSDPSSVSKRFFRPKSVFVFIYHIGSLTQMK